MQRVRACVRRHPWRLSPSGRGRTSPIRAISRVGRGICLSRGSCRPQIVCERVAWSGRCAEREFEGMMDAGTSHAEQLDVGGGTVTALRGSGRPRALPVALSSFVGRESELAELRAVLGQARLVTLTGPGGCGKTRLALELVAERLDRPSVGVEWVDLASLADERRVG